MARPLRITYPGAIYHIINRGSRKDDIFHCARDKDQFLSKLHSSAEKYSIRIYCYCLMDNHFHLLIETPDEKLSEFMHLLQCGYANWYKVRYNLVGPLFQSRFKSVLVENERYLISLSAYIHLNPYRAKMVDNPADYRWSSCRQFLRNEKSELVDPDFVLKYAGGIDNYRYIMQKMIQDVPSHEQIYGKFGILGDASFKDKVVASLKHLEINEKAVLDYRDLKRIEPSVIAHKTSAVLGVSISDLTSKTKGNIARKIYLYLLKKHTSLKIVSIAKLAEMTPFAAGELIRRFNKEILLSKEIEEKLRAVEKQLYPNIVP